MIHESEFQTKNEDDESKNLVLHKLTKIEGNHYYNVSYDYKWYLGKIVQILEENTSNIMFLKHYQDYIIWPEKNLVEKVANDWTSSF